MELKFGFMPMKSTTIATQHGYADALTSLAAHCRSVALAHIKLAEKAESLIHEYTKQRRFCAGLRTFARHHRRIAWQHLETARRAEAASETDPGASY